MNIFERPVNISINKNTNASSGFIWTSVHGKLEKIPFMIDRPRLVHKGFNPSTYLRVVRQIKNLGIDPDTIELHMGDTNYVYDGKQYRNKIGIKMSVVDSKPIPSDLMG